MTTPAAVFVTAALTVLTALATPASADTVRDHRRAEVVRDHRRPTTVPIAPPHTRPRPRPVIQPRYVTPTYRYDSGSFYRDDIGDDRVWIPGSWQWVNGHQVWVAGRWVAARPGLTDPGPSWVHPRDRWTKAPEDWLRN